jgi:hypothetical protein
VTIVRNFIRHRAAPCNGSPPDFYEIVRSGRRGPVAMLGTPRMDRFDAAGCGDTGFLDGAVAPGWRIRADDGRGQSEESEQGEVRQGDGRSSRE